MNQLLKNKICLVTGCNRGIGKSVAERFAEEGAIVFANARKDEILDSWAEECSNRFRTEVHPIYFDIRETNKTKEAILAVKKHYGQIDVLVNNAGIVSYELLELTDINSLREMFEVNVVAMIQLIQITSRIMSRKGSGSIINISSIVGEKGVAGQLGYAATKGAVNSLTKSAAKELASRNIRVNCVAPGMVATERFNKVFQEKFKDRISNVGMGRLGSPKEIADACVFLGSDLSTYITGQILGVDGSTII